MKLSIIIPAYNEELVLPETLERIGKALSVIACPSEIIVVDNVSQDRTKRVAQDFGARVFSETEHNIGKVRNTGAENSTGDVLIFIDATPLRVCHNLRIWSHKVFAGSAARDKSSTGWYFGFKLHLAINERGELLGFYITAAKVDERVTADWITQNLRGKLIGDKGYISTDLFEKLMSRGLRLITKLRRNMKNRLLEVEDKILLRKRAIIETVNDQLKNTSNIEHSRHRSLWNFLGNVAAGLIAYSWKEKKSSLNLNFETTVPSLVI